RLYVAADGVDVLERGEVVMCRRLGVILRPAKRLHPLGRKEMLLAAARTRNLPVRDVADERVAKGVFTLCAHRGAIAAEEPSPVERLERAVDVAAVARCDRGHGIRPEGSSDDGGGLD